MATNINGATISTTGTDEDLTLTPNGSGVVKTDNLALDGNTISSINTDGNVILAPNGSGRILLPKINLPNALAVIASGAITFASTWTTIDTEGAAATDDLDTISGGIAGDVIILQSGTAARVPTVRHVGGGTGNIRLAGGANFVMNATQDKIMLMNYNGTSWSEISRSDNS